MLAAPRSLVATVGERALAGLAYANEIATMGGYAAWRLSFGLRKLRPVTREVLLKQILFTGVEALPFTSLIALLTAFILVVQGHQQLGHLGQEALFGKMLIVVLVRELGPLIVAVIVIGRSGTAIAAELAHMRVNREIQSLEVMGVDPFEYLVVPRLAGVVAALFCLTVCFIGVSLGGGWIMAQLLNPAPMSFGAYATVLAAPLGLGDIASLLLKTVVPGLLIAAIACREGLTAETSVTEVPRATTAGVVTCISAVFVWNAGISALVFLW